jgi:tetratricopeptide (TPR) repeat protein
MSSVAAAVTYWQALPYAAAGSSDKAVAALRELLKQEPENQRVHQALPLFLRQVGLGKCSEGDWPSAADCFTQARTIEREREAACPSSSLEDTQWVEVCAFLLSSRREEMIRSLEETLRRDPLNGVAAHSLGLAAYYAASVLHGTGRWKEAHAYWRTAIATWVTTLNNDAFWEEWQWRRHDQYQTDTAGEDILTLRQLLEEHLAERFLKVHDGASGTPIPTQSGSNG